jgi:metal-dependent amidase/aminoacylase/carboxypeptidase family protein
MLPSNRLHCVILNGGLRANIIPDYSKLEIYIRSQEIEELRDIEVKVKNCIQAASLSTGCTFAITADPVFENVKVRSTNVA